jgi:hypothetical protein
MPKRRADTYLTDRNYQDIMDAEDNQESKNKQEYANLTRNRLGNVSSFHGNLTQEYSEQLNSV